MSLNTRIGSAILSGPMSALGHQDFNNAMFRGANLPVLNSVKVGMVEQFNVGLYSAIISDGESRYTCFIGAQNIAPGFGFSDFNILREGDEVIFATSDGNDSLGMILARKPSLYCDDEFDHVKKIECDTGLERRTHFFSNHCYRIRTGAAYNTPVKDKFDTTTRQYSDYRPTDMVPGEFGTLNQHHCGVFGGIYSTTMVGGRALIRIFSLENRIKEVADSIIKYTLAGNSNEWHNRRYLSRENSVSMYQEERFGVHAKEQKAFRDADYHDEYYWSKNEVIRQTAKPRVLEHTGYYGNLVANYCFRPDPALMSTPRSMNDKPIESGVARQSIDPSGQYRLATTGMLGLERIGRIPVPVRINYPWQSEVEDPPNNTLSEFKHSEDHPYYRQLEHADRVAYDLKNSYSRLDEEGTSFYTPEEEDISGNHQLRDVFDEGFSTSTTVKLEKYDKRRSGLWQGEDGSIILRDAWGSEIVMIGGNIQISCAGNVQILPGKSALTIAGDDIVQKAQNSIDIHSAEKDVRIDAFRNVQMMAGMDDGHPGGVTIESRGNAAPWDAKSSNGGEDIMTTGILLKSESGNIVTDTKNLILRSRKYTGILSGDKSLTDGGQIMMSSTDIYSHASGGLYSMTDNSAVIMTGNTAAFVGGSVIVAGSNGCGIFSEGKILIPLMWLECSDPASETMDKLQTAIKVLKDESKVGMGYDHEKLDKMYFKFRNSEEDNTKSSWEIQGSDHFTMYEPFWVQVKSKFETLSGVSTKSFEDHYDTWKSNKSSIPWPGEVILDSAQYAQISGLEPVNMTNTGLNVSRKSVKDSTPVQEVPLKTNYKIRN